MALFITLGLISRPSAKMLSLAQHPDYAQHLSVYAVSCTVTNNNNFHLCCIEFHGLLMSTKTENWYCVKEFRNIINEIF
jgi:hypothetical protein